MAESSTTALVFLFQEKLALHRELIGVLKKERAWIISADTDRLWQSSDKKQQVVAGIESLRGRILEILTAAGIGHGMTIATFRASMVIRLVPVATRRALVDLQSALVLAKEEIQQRARENSAFIEESLSTLDALIGIFTRSGDDGIYYDRNRHAESTASRSLLHQEV